MIGYLHRRSAFGLLLAALGLVACAETDERDQTLTEFLEENSTLIVDLGSYDNEARREAVNRIKQLPVPRPCAQREIQGVALPRSLSGLIFITGARVGIELVDGTKQHLVGTVEDLLGAVPVMTINIQDEHFFSLIDQFLAGNGDVIEEAEAIGPGGFCMMSGWTDHREIALLRGHKR